MLKIEIPVLEGWNEERQCFVENKKPREICFEHSLISISKWESKWHKPFLHTENKTSEEVYDYIRCMCITPNVDPDIFWILPTDCYRAINDYLKDPMTATTIKKDPTAQKNREIVTSEVIYYWMISLQIPLECDKWNFNRLWALIEVCSEKNKPAKKMKPADIAKQYSAINAANRKRFKSKG